MNYVLLLQFCSTLEANILRVQGVVTNCTITSVVLGSVKVSNTLAFTGSDAAAAEAARNSVATALASTNTADYFGTSFGTVSVSDVASTNSANPQGETCYYRRTQQVVVISVCLQHFTCGLGSD